MMDFLTAEQQVAPAFILIGAINVIATKRRGLRNIATDKRIVEQLLMCMGEEDELGEGGYYFYWGKK